MVCGTVLLGGHGAATVPVVVPVVVPVPVVLEGEVWVEPVPVPAVPVPVVLPGVPVLVLVEVPVVDEPVAGVQGMVVVAPGGVVDGVPMVVEGDVVVVPWPVPVVVEGVCVPMVPWFGDVVVPVLGLVVVEP